MEQDISILWITDDWETLDHTRDTTLRLMQESVALGLNSYWSTPSDIHIRDNEMFVLSRKLVEVNPERQQDSFLFGSEELCHLTDFISIHLRVDPPVNEAYVALVNLLSTGLKKELSKSSFLRMELVNSPEVVLMVNSKLEGLLLDIPSPKTVVTNRAAIAEQFGREVKVSVIKPVAGGNCKGVELLFLGFFNCNS